ncbi:Protein of unknown function [Cotesia congregata]|uniref:Endonuclease/exonuclease/phosphatase domain-containing protein n=1 Tax=Cotesia congregata TaxID=51543 RepID=A0A8J2HAQ2_COTCN|nr:Protein of unknown function [Cotesia congregata]
MLLSTKFDLFIIGGDFNARLGTLNTVSPEAAAGSRVTLIRHSMDTKITQRGTVLNDFMEEHGFVLLNGRCHPDIPSRHTFFGAQGLSVVELVWVNASSLDLISEFRVDQSSYRSDHYPITVKIATGTHGPRTASPPTARRTVSRLKWDQSAAPTFQHAMRWSPLAMFVNKDMSANSLNANLVKAIQLGAESSELISTSSNARKPLTHKPWFDVDCRSAKRQLMELHSICRSHNFSYPSNNGKFLQLRASYQKLVSDKKKKLQEKSCK